MSVSYSNLRLEPVEATASAAFYEASAIYSMPIKAKVKNISSTKVTLNIWDVKSGGEPTDENLYYSKDIAAGELRLISSVVNDVMSSGDAVWVSASAEDSLIFSMSVKESS